MGIYRRANKEVPGSSAVRNFSGNFGNLHIFRRDVNSVWCSPEVVDIVGLSTNTADSVLDQYIWMGLHKLTGPITRILAIFIETQFPYRSRWLCGVRPTVSPLLRSRVRIPVKTRISIWCVWCVGKGVFHELITNTEESYRVLCVCVELCVMKELQKWDCELQCFSTNYIYK